MAVRLPDRVDTTPAWPNQSEAARMIGVSEPTLLRANLPFDTAGAREKRYRPVTVLRAAQYFRKATLPEVAQALIDLCEEKHPSLLTEMTGEVEQAMAELTAGEGQRLKSDDVLAELKSILPRKYHGSVEEIYRRGAAGPREDGPSQPSTARPSRATKAPAGRRSARRGPALVRS